MKLVHVTKVNSRNFVTDFTQDIKNIVGGPLKAYEKMIEKAIDDAQTELFNKYPGVEDVKLQITEFKNASISVTVYGVWNG